MKMKKIVYIFFFVGALGLNSCSSILDTPPTSTPSESVYWQSKADFESALTACYQGMQGETLSWIIPTFDCLTDNAYGNQGSSKIYNADMIQADNIDPSTTGLIENIYKEAYNAIARINIFMEQLNKYQGADIASVRNQMEGEALFLRSYCYYLLYMFYGEVPYIDKPLTLETQNMPKNTLEEVYTKLTTDLQSAINKMDDKTYKEAGGHATQGAAKALKARVLMFHAYGDDGTVAHIDELEEAYTLLGTITGYSLDDNYADIFRPANQENSDEIIFSIKYLAPNSYHIFDNSYGNYGMLNPVEDLTKEYEEGDNRLNQIIAFNDVYQWEGGDMINLTKSSNGKRMIKWLRPVLKQSDFWNQTERSEQDIVILRWGELLLLRAEAANELGKPGAADMVKLVRKRAGLEALPDGLNQAQMREAIRHERRVETPFELIRYYDMRRWKIMDKLNGLVLDPLYTNIIPAWSKKHEYLPLPQGQIDFSNGVLVQNPNY